MSKNKKIHKNLRFNLFDKYFVFNIDKKSYKINQNKCSDFRIKWYNLRRIYLNKKKAEKIAFGLFLFFCFPIFCFVR